MRKSRLIALQILGIALYLGSCGLLFRHYSKAASRSDSEESVFTQFGNRSPVSNTFFMVYGFLQGNTCYYRFEAASEDIQRYITKNELVEIPRGKPAVKTFCEGEPSWWKPSTSSETHYYGNAYGHPIFSFDKAGRCYIKK